MAFYSRSDWGARAARPGPGPLDRGQVGGIALHYPGMKSKLRGFKAVAAALRGWQDYHMDDKGWSDIAYQIAIDQDGNRYRLRGLENQSGANGDTDVNERFGAVLLVLAVGESPSPAMVRQVRRAIERHRKLFPNSRLIVPHSDLNQTACPGDVIRRYIAAQAFGITPARRRRTP
jgi:hypothetical protein